MEVKGIGGVMRIMGIFSVASALAWSLLVGSDALALTFYSSAEEWGALGSDKQVYINGFCAGASGTDIGRLHFGDTKNSINSNSPSAFCGQAYEPKGVNPIGKGIGFVNSFYKDDSHSDVPLWAVVRYFNDKACSEGQVSGRIPALQEKFLCLRQTSNMIAMGVRGDVLRAQQNKCEKLP